MNPALSDFSRLCIHTITTKPWDLETAVEKYALAGVRGITVWRQTLAGRDIGAAGRQIREAGLDVVSLCRGGFFPSPLADQRRAAIEDNLRCIDDAAALGAPMVVLVCGAHRQLPLSTAREQIVEGVSQIAEHAARANVRLAIEPLHPMYADDRSAVNTIAQAREICDRVRSPWVGVAVDCYHVWWDETLKSQIQQLGDEKRLFAFHVCDWRTPTVDLLNDRGLMGEGCIPIRQIRSWVEVAGFDGYNEVEIFSNRLWAEDQDVFLQAIKTAYLEHC